MLLSTNIIVDGYLNSKDTEEDALQTILEVKQQGSFDLVNWLPSSQLRIDRLNENRNYENFDL